MDTKTTLNLHSIFPDGRYRCDDLSDYPNSGGSCRGGQVRDCGGPRSLERSLPSEYDANYPNWDAGIDTANRAHGSRITSRFGDCRPTPFRQSVVVDRVSLGRFSERLLISLIIVRAVEHGCD